MLRPTAVLVPIAMLMAAAFCLQGSRPPVDGKLNKLDTAQTAPGELLNLGHSPNESPDAPAQTTIAAAARMPGI